MPCKGYRLYVGLIFLLCGIALLIIGAISIFGGVPVQVGFVVAGCAAIIGAIIWLLSLFLRQCLFPVSSDENIAHTARFHLPSRLVELEGKRPALIVSPRNRSRAPCQLALIWLHGNAMTIADCESMCQTFADTLGASILIPEYPGYGVYRAAHPNASPCVSSINAVAEAAMDYATTTMGHALQHILVVGHSIGTGPAAELAGNHRIGGVVLISPYTTLSSVIARVVSFYTCGVVGKCIGCAVRPCVRWEPMESLRQSTCPVLLLHGALDSLIVCRHSVQLLGAVSGVDIPDSIEMNTLRRFGRVWIRLASEADHVDWSGGQDILMPVARFIADAITAPSEDS
eukprot:TRINITY_DN7070_c1_g1_i1.p1 TRINITY_DN7070_c1_g1~~TRINITY_DN7070_c1_g1_i1.p1  ORF type:complete len:343 (+),score=94.82 TRINITY_DN7070_c1_g1_i1:104-1132(+)